MIVSYSDLKNALRLAEEVKNWSSEVLIVINDGLETFKQTDDFLTIISSGINLGYAGAINYALGFLGSQGAATSVVCVLNTDVEIPQLAALQCIQAVEDSQFDIIGPSYTDSQGHNHVNCGQVSRIIKRISVQSISGCEDIFSMCDWIQGSIMFISRQLLSKLSFCETYFLGYEDVDYCISAKKIGYSTAVLKVNGVMHEGGRSIGNLRWNYYLTRNSVWFTYVQGGIARAVLQWTFQMLILPAKLVKVRGLRNRIKFARFGILGLIHAVLPQTKNHLPS